MRSFLFISTVLFFVGISTAQILTFDCSSIPEVCTNMCWAVHCTNRRWSNHLTLDNVSKTKNRQRRRAAGCSPSPNRCSIKSGHAPGYNCDEYPFASAAEADSGGQSNRCVPISQNSAQGGMINAFYRNLPIGTQFTVAFLSPSAGGTKYCVNGRNVCVNDGNQYTKTGPQPNPPGWVPRSVNSGTGMHMYETVSGKTLTSTELFQPGYNVTSPVPVDPALYARMIEGEPSDLTTSALSDPDFWSLESEVIAREISLNVDKE